MEYREREARLLSASALLTILKLHGGSARMAADWLGVSPTTITNWHRVREKKTRKQGVPSDRQLQRLAVLAAWQVRQACSGMRFYLNENGLRPRESVVLIQLLRADYRVMADYLDQRAESSARFLQELRGLVAKYGEGALDCLLQPINVAYHEQMPDPSTVKPPPHVDAEERFRELEVPEQQLQAMQEELQVFFAARGRTMVRKALGSTREQKPPAPE